MSSPAAVDSWEETEAQSCPGEDEAAFEDLELGSEQSQHCMSQGRRKTRMLGSVLAVLIKILVRRRYICRVGDLTAASIWDLIHMVIQCQYKKSHTLSLVHPLGT